jgi:hypothetical protein
MLAYATKKVCQFYLLRRHRRAHDSFLENAAVEKAFTNPVFIFMGRGVLRRVCRVHYIRLRRHSNYGIDET